MLLKEYLISKEFEQKLPWQFHDDNYMIVYIGKDSYGFELWSITNKRYDERVFRGRIISLEDFKHIFVIVKEDYNLEESEIQRLKKEIKIAE